MDSSGFDHKGDGFALPAALLAIMAIGTVVTGGFYASSQKAQATTRLELQGAAVHAEAPCPPADSVTGIERAGVESTTSGRVRQDREKRCGDR
ncbi:MAG: hypothetical protein R3314_07180 [Longimicrobiales bacterium]|nr:hypothetical protein [Longimicrobiales bacterium]